MVKVSNTNNDKYDEYLWVEGALEKVGAWEVDLTDYATKNEVALKVDKKDGYELISIADIAKLSTIEENAQVNIINSVDEVEFNVVNKHLSINSISASKVKNLEGAKAIQDLNASLKALTQKVDTNTGHIATNTSSITILTSTVQDIQKSLNNYVTVAQYTAEMNTIKDAIKWHEV